MIQFIFEDKVVPINGKMKLSTFYNSLMQLTNDGRKNYYQTSASLPSPFITCSQNALNGVPLSLGEHMMLMSWKTRENSMHQSRTCTVLELGQVLTVSAPPRCICVSDAAMKWNVVELGWVFKVVLEVEALWKV